MHLLLSFEQNGKSVELLKSKAGWILRFPGGEESFFETCWEVLNQFDNFAWGMKCPIGQKNPV